MPGLAPPRDAAIADELDDERCAQIVVTARIALRLGQPVRENVTAKRRDAHYAAPFTSPGRARPSPVATRYSPWRRTPASAPHPSIEARIRPSPRTRRTPCRPSPW